MQLSLTYKRCACEKCDSTKDCLTSNAKSINDRSKQPTGQPVRHRTFSRARQSRPRARHSYGNQQHRLDHTYAAAEVISDPIELPAAAMSNELQLEQNQQYLLLQECKKQHQELQYQYTEGVLDYNDNIDVSGTLSPKVNGNFGLSGTRSPKAVNPQRRLRYWGKLSYEEEEEEGKENHSQQTITHEMSKHCEKNETVNINKIPGISTTAINTSKAMPTTAINTSKAMPTTAINTSNAFKMINEERSRWIAANALLEFSRVPVVFYN